MAYTRKNLLGRILDIQEIYLHYQKLGVNPTNIFAQHIRPVYRISRSTFYRYLAINAKKELKKMEAAENQAGAQQKLFGDEEET